MPERQFTNAFPVRRTDVDSFGTPPGPAVPIAELRALLHDWRALMHHWQRNADLIDEGLRPGRAERLHHRARDLADRIEDLAAVVTRHSPEGSQS